MKKLYILSKKIKKTLKQKIDTLASFSKRIGHFFLRKFYIVKKGSKLP